MNNIESQITVPIGQKAHSTAGQFAVLATSPDKGRQVYLNTLAVYAVRDYLDWLHIASDLEQGDSWNIGIQNLADVADLVLPKIGSLECRSVLPGETSFVVSPQATENRIGYVAVRLNESLDRAELLGFLGAISPSERVQQISLTLLQPMDVLLERIPVTARIASDADKTVVNLSGWLKNIFEDGWLMAEALFDSQTANPALSARSESKLGNLDANNLTDAVARGKLIDLGIQLAGQKVALVVTCQPVEDEIEVRLQLYPIEQFRSLPPELQLTVLDKTGAGIPELQVQARSADDCIQLEFTGAVGEQFSVVIALEDVSITEEFQI